MSSSSSAVVTYLKYLVYGFVRAIQDLFRPTQTDVALKWKPDSRIHSKI